MGKENITAYDKLVVHRLWSEVRPLIEAIHTVTEFLRTPAPFNFSGDTDMQIEKQHSRIFREKNLAEVFRILYVTSLTAEEQSEKEKFRR